MFVQGVWFDEWRKLMKFCHSCINAICFLWSYAIGVWRINIKTKGGNHIASTAGVMSAVEGPLIPCIFGTVDLQWKFSKRSYGTCCPYYKLESNRYYWHLATKPLCGITASSIHLACLSVFSNFAVIISFWSNIESLGSYICLIYHNLMVTQYIIGSGLLCCIHLQTHLLEPVYIILKNLSDIREWWNLSKLNLKLNWLNWLEPCANDLLILLSMLLIFINVFIEVSSDGYPGWLNSVATELWSLL